MRNSVRSYVDLKSRKGPATEETGKQSETRLTDVGLLTTHDSPTVPGLQLRKG